MSSLTSTRGIPARCSARPFEIARRGSLTHQVYALWSWRRDQTLWFALTRQ